MFKCFNNGWVVWPLDLIFALRLSFNWFVQTPSQFCLLLLKTRKTCLFQLYKPQNSMAFYSLSFPFTMKPVLFCPQDCISMWKSPWQNTADRCLKLPKLCLVPDNRSPKGECPWAWFILRTVKEEPSGSLLLACKTAAISCFSVPLLPLLAPRTKAKVFFQ